MPIQQRVELCLTGTRISPDEITRLLGVAPTRVWRLGEPIQGTALRAKHNGWCFAQQLAEDASLADRARSLLVELLPRAKTITRICSEFDLDCELACVAYVTDHVPELNFDSEIISGLAELKAILDIDIILTK
jgi:hypothetical protein